MKMFRTHCMNSQSMPGSYWANYQNIAEDYQANISSFERRSDKGSPVKRRIMRKR